MTGKGKLPVALLFRGTARRTLEGAGPGGGHSPQCSPGARPPSAPGSLEVPSTLSPWFSGGPYPSAPGSLWSAPSAPGSLKESVPFSPWFSQVCPAALVLPQPLVLTRSPLSAPGSLESVPSAPWFSLSLVLWESVPT